MNNLYKEVGQLDLKCLFLHADEVVYSKLMMIKWLNEGLYDKIFQLWGDFHTLLVKLKILHKKYGLLGTQDWWVDSNVVVVGSADKALLSFNPASQAVFWSTCSFQNHENFRKLEP